MAVLKRVALLVALVALAAAQLLAQNSTVAQTRSVSTSGTLQSAAVANGNGTALLVDGYAVLTVTVNCASCSGGTTVNFELSEDGTNFSAQQATLVGGSTLASSTTTAGVTVWTLAVAGFRSARARISSYSAGTVTVTGHAVPLGAPTVVAVSNAPHVTVDSAPTTAVTGTFWQATQPVSGTFWQTTQPVSGTFWQTTQPVSFTMPSLVAGVALIGKVGFDQTTPGTTNGVSLNQISGTALTIGQQTAANSIPVILPSATVTTLTPPTAAAIGTSVSADLLLGTQVAGSSVPVALPTATITTLTPPTAAAVGTSVSADLLIGTQAAGASVPTALPTATITTLTPPTAAAVGTAVSADLLIGTQLAAASVPVALPAATITALTPPTTITANAGTNLNTSALALSATQTNGSQKTQLVDGSGNVIASTSNNLNVQCANCSGSGASAADGASFTPGASSFAPIGGEFTTGSLALTSGTQGMAELTAYRGLQVALFDAFGTATGTAPNPLYTSAATNTAVTPATGARRQTVDQTWGMRLMAGGFNTPIGANGDRLKVDVLTTNPCAVVPFDAAVSQTATAKIISGLPGQRTIICAVRLVVGAAEITSELEGTGTNCGTGTIAHSGSTTAANGESFAINGGYSTSVPFALRAGDDFCIGQSGSSRVSGKVSYVYAP